METQYECGQRLNRKANKGQCIWLGDEHDGLVFINVEGTEWTYRVDAALISKWRYRFSFSPWAVLNEIKAHVKAKGLWCADSRGEFHDYSEDI